MYLVELRPGREKLFQSVEALAAAIRRSDVTAHSRIFHCATAKWISITLHPQFKANAVVLPREPLPPLPRKQWTFLAAEAGEPEIDHATTATAAVSAVSTGERTGGQLFHPRARRTGSAWRRLFAG